MTRWDNLLIFSSGVAHSNTEDDEYEGYFIPKGTIMIPNVWAMHRDREMFGEDVESFRPERYIDSNGCLISGFSESKEEGHFTFGFGRRVSFCL